MSDVEWSVKQDQLICDYLRETIKKQRGRSPAIKATHWAQIARKLGRPASDVAERYTDTIQYNSKLSHGLPFVGTTPSPKVLKRKRLEEEEEEEEEEYGTPNRSLSRTPKRKIDFDNQNSVTSTKKQKRTPRSILRSFQRETTQNDSLINNEIQQDKNIPNKKEIEKCSKLLTWLGKKTGRKNKEKLLHALYINSGDIENTIKFLRDEDFNVKMIWSAEEDEQLKSKKNLRILQKQKGITEMENRMNFLETVSKNF
eukprot:gene5319-9129_t